jgi:hypothetical protein
MDLDSSRRESYLVTPGRSMPRFFRPCRRQRLATTSPRTHTRRFHGFAFSPLVVFLVLSLSHLITTTAVLGFTPSLSSRQPQQRVSDTSFGKPSIVPRASHQTIRKSWRQSAPLSAVPLTATSVVAAKATAAAAALAAITGAVSGGVFAGGLHAIAGPDHLAALLPRCCGQRWYVAGRVGALWGMGHGVSATMLGMAAFAFKNAAVFVAGSTTGTTASSSRLFTAVLSKMSHITEVAVGLSLIIIGVMGIHEARIWEVEADSELSTTETSTPVTLSTQPQKSLSAAVVPVKATAVHDINDTQKRAIVLNGLLHGFSWDGAPSLAPAIAVTTWASSLAFLASYAVGTMITMAVTTTLIGEGTRRAGKLFHRPDLPQKLSYVSSCIAIVIGSVWCGLPFFQ